MSLRMRAFLRSLLAPGVLALYCIGYVMGAHAAHPESILANVVAVLVVWIVSIIGTLWIAAGEMDGR